MTKENFSAEYATIYKDLYKMALYTLGNEEDAKDMVSETVLDAYKDIGKLRDDTKFRSWIFKILSNKCKRKIKEYISVRDFFIELDENTPFYDKSSDDKVLLEQAYKAISKKERLIINMIVVAGFNSRETAKILFMKDTTVRSIYSRALKKMQSSIEGGYYEG